MDTRTTHRVQEALAGELRLSHVPARAADTIALLLVLCATGERLSGVLANDHIRGLLLEGLQELEQLRMSGRTFVEWVIRARTLIREAR